MTMFDPKTEYDVVRKDFPIRDFHEYKEEFVVRPPYQRKNVWSRKKQQDLLDSLFRRYYVPRIVIREVRLDEDRAVYEVIDGQQRIHTAQLFLADNLPLPKTLEDLHPTLPGARFSSLTVEMRRFIDRIVYVADLVKGVDNPRDPDHQKVATEIFWRLQQGESLTYMEVAHSRLSSLARNFVVKYADDQRFDYDTYMPIDGNPDKHPFFQIIARNNNRMQHLALLTRLLLLEENGGPADMRNADVLAYTEKYERPDGIGNWTMDEFAHAKRVLQHLHAFYDVFQDDPMLMEGGRMKEFRIEYFVISVYLLLRHLRTHYAFGDPERRLFHEFAVAFHERWAQSRREDDTAILMFSDNRQQTRSEIEARDRIIRQAFFDYAAARDHEMQTKDEQRVFTEAERIRIYRHDNGLCQMCLAEGKPEQEARVPWREYEADHVIPHSLGGQTDVENAQVLCRHHNRQKGARAGLPSQ